MVWRISVRCTSEEAAAMRETRAGLADLDRFAFVSIHPAAAGGAGWIADVYTRQQPSPEMLTSIGRNLPSSGVGIPNILHFGRQIDAAPTTRSRKRRYGELLRAAFG